MIEYGLSVSLNTTPRPNTPTEEDNTLTWAPRKRHSVHLSAAVVDTAQEEEEEDSISPRVLFSQDEDEDEDEIPAIVRRLDFDDSGLGGGGGVTMEISSFRTVSQGNTTTAEFEFEEEESVGDCGVCYSQLPLRANHIFTLCGHLFCVRCLLKWWDTNTTCPICRAELFVEDVSIPVVIDPVPDNHGDDEEDNEEIWVRREMWNGRWPPPAGDASADDAAVDNDRTTDDDNDNYNDNDNDNDDDQRLNEPITRMNQYLYQDAEWNWSLYSPLSDDTLIPYLTPGEIYGLRENREIATTLFARSRFRNTLLVSSLLFMGRVWNGILVHKNHWTNIMLYRHFDEQRNRSSTCGMFEFVIRKESSISPVYEINIFGFMKDVIIITDSGSVSGAAGSGSSMYNDDDDDDEWENRSEYAFVADVFTPTDFYIGDNMQRSYGSYDITEGIINTHELVIPFLQIRRLYRLTSHEQLDI
jgi:hypothetical protein